MKQYISMLLSLITIMFVVNAQELTISDNIGREWINEPVTWELPGVKGDTVLLKRDGKPIAGQVVSSAAGTHILCIIDKLAKDEKTKLIAEIGKTGSVTSDLKIVEGKDGVVLSNAFTAIKLPSFSIRTTSGKWTAGAVYDANTAKQGASTVEILERGPVRIKAKMVTTFDNGRNHIVIVSIWSGSHSIDIDEVFNIGPDDKYQQKRYKNDRDELAWEWWSWYGDREGVNETHPNKWIVRLDGDGYAPDTVTYCGNASTDTAKGPMQSSPHQLSIAEYSLAHGQPRRLEKYIGAHSQWRPDSALWYLTSVGKDNMTDAMAIYPHTARDWRNPNMMPAPQGITLRTGINDLRIVSRDGGKKLEVECPVGSGHRCWSIRTSTRQEMLAPAATSPTALDAERVQRCMGLDITRNWITSWDSKSQYPRLFIKPEQKEAYYARLKGKGIGAQGNLLDTFLRNQDQISFDKDYGYVMKQADDMLSGYLKSGMDNTIGYPGWMLGYWHGIIVASGLDNLAGSDFCTPEKKAVLQKKLAILTYCLTSRDAWSDKQINYGWGSMNMPVGRWGGLVVMASALGDHPMVETWLRDAGRYFNMLLKTEYSSDGVGVSCPHYIGASSTNFYAWIIMANSGKFGDVSKEPVLKKFSRYYMQLMTPIDKRWGIRVLLNEGDTRTGSSPYPGILGTLFRVSDPELAGQLMQMWKEGGADLSAGMGVPDLLIVDPAVPVKPLAMKSEVYPGFGAFLRRRSLSTPQESYLAFVGGNFMIDHANTDQLSFHWHDKGVPLSVFNGSLYQPMTCTALSHNTISWDVRPGGARDPGKDQPGNWYHDNSQPFVDLGGVTPTTHYEIGWDKANQLITDTRGMVTLATECDNASLLEGKVDIKSMVEQPTRATNYEIAIASQAWPPAKKLEKTFTWTRRLISVQAPVAEGMNYLVIRDDFGGWAERTPNFSYWALADDVEFDGNKAFFKGSLGIDTGLYVAAPTAVKLYKDKFTNTQCESAVSIRHQNINGKTFSETYSLTRVEGQKGQDFFVALFPYKTDEPKPVVEAWGNDKGLKITWKNEVHYVMLDTEINNINLDGIKAKTSALIVKVTDKKNYSICLPAGGEISFRGKRLKGISPSEITIVNGKFRKSPGKDLMVKGK